jgi:DNA-binding CsgD family transcriptional regulator
MQLIRKNEVLLEIRQRVSALGRDNHQVQQLKHLLEQELSSENDWAVFEENFNSVHEAFLKKMKTSYPELTPGDLRLAAYLKMNLSSKEIAPLMGISIRGLENKRYRLRKKMQLDSDDNLVAFLLEF